ncbi:MAG: transcriptional regulator, partial [Bacteroidetes bacterium]
MNRTKIVDFEDHLKHEYGERGTEKREKFEEGFEAFKIGALIYDLRKNQGLT